MENKIEFIIGANMGQPIITTIEVPNDVDVNHEIFDENTSIGFIGCEVDSDDVGISDEDEQKLGGE